MTVTSVVDSRTTIPTEVPTATGSAARQLWSRTVRLLGSVVARMAAIGRDETPTYRSIEYHERMRPASPGMRAAGWRPFS